jgi:hypothetical protein
MAGALIAHTKQAFAFVDRGTNTVHWRLVHVQSLEGFGFGIVQINEGLLVILQAMIEQIGITHRLVSSIGNDLENTNRSMRVHTL